MIRYALLAALLVAAAGALAAAETATTPLQLPVPDAGNVALAPPPAWSCRVSGGYPTLRCEGVKANSFSVLVTAIARQPGKLESEADLEAAARGAGALALPSSEQKEIKLRRIAGAQTTGYFYALTDRSPEKGPGDFREMSQGMVFLGPFVLSVTILTHTGDTATVEAAVAMVTAATAAKSPSSEPSAASVPAELRLVVQKTAGGYELSVPVSRLVLTIPEPGVSPEPVATGGAAASPRYFSLRDKQRGLIITGWFESSGGYQGLEASWAADTEQWKKGGVPEPQNVSFATLGQWHCVRYDNPLPGMTGSNTHIRAHYVGAGTWIDVHLSLTSSKPVEDVRAELGKVLEGFQVREKSH